MSRSYRRVYVSILCLTMCLGCSQKAGTENSDSDSNETQSAADQSALNKKAISLNNRGVAHLENKEWQSAESCLAELAETLPESTPALQNLAIGRVLVLIDRESPYSQTGTAAEIAAYRNARLAAESAIDSFEQLAATEFEQALADLLRGKLLVHVDSSAQPTFADGVAHLRMAADRLPDRADFRLALALAMDGSVRYSDQRKPGYKELLAELEKSFDLAPNNLYAMIVLLKRQALGLTSTVEANTSAALRITDTMKAARDLVAPFNESIRKSQRIDLLKTIDDALAKFDPTRPASLVGPGMVTFNLLNPELASQVDQRRINRNLLEYLQLDLGSQLRKGISPSEFPATVVKSFDSKEGLPDLSGVTSVAVQDFDLDGLDDLVLTRAGGIEVYGRSGSLDGKWSVIAASGDLPFEVTDLLLLDIDRDFDRAVPAMNSPFLLRDADGDQKIPTDPAGVNRWFDADLDIVAWAPEGIIVLQNVLEETGRRTLRILAQAEQLADVNDVVAADFEFDGDLDLAIATGSGITLWQNINGTTFSNMNASATLPDVGVSALRIADFNDDLAIDIGAVFMGDGKLRIGILENVLHGRFRWLPSSKSVGNGVAVSATNFQVTGVLDASPDFLSREIIGADFDNDSYMDALSYSDSQAVCVRGVPGKMDSAGFPELPEGMTAAAVADLDQDGDSDIIYADTDGRLKLLDNVGGNTNNWLDVVARAVPDDDQFPANRVNMHSIGSTIELRAGQLYCRQVITQPRVHFGLGQQTKADAIRIIWTDGVPQNVSVPELLKNKVGVLAPQILKGSCPYIYTWTGEKFEFFSDCLWAAPIGLVQATGEIAPTREWENLLIPGEQLVENDGQYQLQLTEELWEIAYFDHVELTSIDHPADVSIFTNEKVGPPQLAEHRVHTVQSARLPRAVRNGRGRDLLPGLTSKDGDYVQAFQGRILQGLTDEWTMEFDLGDLSSDVPDEKRNIRLFLLGWIFPTDTSLNLQIETNPALEPPVPPVVEIPDGAGGWEVALPFIGFPAGKTKAMVVDISNVLKGDNTRFRLRSTMELYWDQVFFTLNEVDAETHAQTCQPAGSDLHYRGFSRRVYGEKSLFRNGRAPEGYDYDQATTDPRWPTISGRFTRYGDVSPLTKEHDDRLVVMGPGDELTLTFTAPEDPVPAGWKRDFILRNVGYDKDADLNTIYGQSSEPFPFRAMSRYPFAVDESVPDSPEYLQYVNKWQTREYSPDRFRDLLRP